MNECGFRVLHPKELFDLTEKIIPARKLKGRQKDDYLELIRAVCDLRTNWDDAWKAFGEDPSGELTFRDLIVRFIDKTAKFIPKGLIEDTGKKAIKTIYKSMFLFKARNLCSLNLLNKLKRERDCRNLKKKFCPPVFENPIFILSAPRAGSTLLFETLLAFPNIWTIGQESHETVEGIEELHPASFGYASNRLIEENAKPYIACELTRRFALQLKNFEGRSFLKLTANERPGKLRFLEKTPKNALRVPFLNAVFPGARFIFLYRDAKENISSLMEGWRSRRYVSYRDLPGWPFKEWSFLLIPGWCELTGATISEIAAYQWMTANDCILKDLETMPGGSWLAISFLDLVEKSEETVKKIASFANLKWDEKVTKKVSRPLPISGLTLTKPAPEKWRKNYKDIMRVLPKVRPTMNNLESLTR